MLAAAVGVLGVREILRINTLPIHLAFVFPYLEIVTSIVDAEFNSADLNSYFYGHGSEVFVFSLMALSMCFIGWNSQLKSKHSGAVRAIEQSLVMLSIRKLFMLYLLFQGISLLTDAIIPFGSSLKQLEQHIRVLRTVCFALIFWRYKVKQDDRLVFAAFLTYALATSLFSFFSAWKSLFIYAGFVLLIRDAMPTGRVLRNLSMVTGIGLMFVMTWQGVKSEYRNFLNEGTGVQRVSVSQSEGLQKFLELTQQFWFDENSVREEWYSVKTSEEAFQSSLERVGYLDLFARMRQYVPSEIPHENGALLSGNLSFALIPRILNPNKGIKDDQWKVEKYAKRNIADNASFSLGHYAEHYIDFGRYGMLLALFCFGAIGGWLTLKTLRGEGVMAAADAAFAFYWMQYFVSFQFDAIKIYGLVFWSIVTYALVWRRILKSALIWARVN